MAVPKRRVSKTKKRMRRTNLKKSVRSFIECPECHAMIQAHRACPKCGYYKGKEVISKNDDEEVKDTKIKTKKEVKAEKEIKETKKTKKKEVKEEK